MQNPMQNLDKAPLFSRNKVFCLEDRKLWRPPTKIELNIFCRTFAHVFHFFTFGIFYFGFNLSYLQKSKNTWFLHNIRNQVFYIFINNLDLNKIKNIPNTLLQKLLRIWRNIGFWQSSFVWKCFVFNLSSFN